MSIALKVVLALVPLAAAAGLARADDEAPLKPLTAVEREARFYEDLGPGLIDVSSYPAERQAQYSVFQSKCAQCHSLARPINAPFVTKQDWKRFIHRMRHKAVFTKGKSLPPEDAEQIVDFLAYDGQLRKVKSKQAWDKEQDELKAYFKDVQARRLAIEDREARDKAKEDPMGPEVRPQPQPQR